MDLRARIEQPIATEAQWATKSNVVLKAGQTIFYVYYDGSGKITAVRSKTGDGVKTIAQLPFLGGEVYTGANPSISLGGILSGQNIQNLSPSKILELLLTPYQAPVISSLTNNYGGSNQNSNLVEVGRQISGSFSLFINKSNNDNIQDSATSGLVASSHPTIFSAGIGNFNLKSNNTRVMTLNNTTYNTITNIRMTVSGINSNGGAIAGKDTWIRYAPAIIWGVSNANKLVTSNDVMALATQGKKLQQDRYGDFNLAGGGLYPYICIAQMVDQSSIQFWDIVSGQLGFQYPFNLQNSTTQSGVYDTSASAVINVNNGFTTIPYNVYRNTYRINDPSTVRIL